MVKKDVIDLQKNIFAALSVGMADSFSRRQPQKVYPLPAALRNEFSESL